MWSGPPSPSIGTVVLLHGILSSRYLVPTARHLAERCRVVAVDRPGFGRSPPTRTAQGIPEMADTVARWMAASDLDGGTVVGHSVGAQVLAQLAVRHPDAVGRAVVVGPTVDWRGPSVSAQWRRWMANAALEPPSFNALVAYEVAEIGPRWMVRTFRHAVVDLIEENLAAAACPVLLVRGERDLVAPQQWLEDLRGRLPGSELVVVPGAAHTVVYSHPAHVARIVADFAGRP